MEVGGRRSQLPASNALVLYVGERWNPDTAGILRDGLRACRRDDAGLLVLILFKEGSLTAGGPDLRSELDRLSTSLEAPVLANEDVQGSWSAALGFRSGGGERAWRLISPRGGVTWMHDGRIAAEALGAALDGYLLPSPPPQAKQVRPHVEVGMPMAATALHPGFGDMMAEAESRCPPLPLGRFGSLGSIVAFVNLKADSSRAQLREIADRYAGSGDEFPSRCGRRRRRGYGSRPMPWATNSAWTSPRCRTRTA